MFTYYPKDVCPSKFEFGISKDGVITHFSAEKGCAGNLGGIGALITGMRVDDVITRLGGTLCDGGESCPNQIAVALLEYKRTEENK